MYEAESIPFIDGPSLPKDWISPQPHLPWIFFGIVSRLGGIQMHKSIAAKNPKDISYVMTTISNIIAAIMTYLFSTAVGCLAKKQIIHKGMAIGHASFFTSLKNRTPSLSLFYQGRHDLFFMVILYSITFLLITPGITTLLTPYYFIRTVLLHGQELDFASNDTDCINWFKNNNT